MATKIDSETSWIPFTGNSAIVDQPIVSSTLFSYSLNCELTGPEHSMLFTDIFYLKYLVPGIVVYFACLIIVLTKAWHGKHSFDTLEGVQKFHCGMTPRIGGVALMSGLISAWLIFPRPLSHMLGQMLVACVPAFLAGLLEDFTKRVGVLQRLLATVFSGVVAYWLTGYTLNKVEVVGIDILLGWLPVSIVFTSIAIGGIANAVNMIDGFNGLAAGTLMIGFGAFGIIAMNVRDSQLAILCLLFIIVLAGFMLLNFPFGKIFMGDGGAYMMGFFLAWVAVLLPLRNNQVSKWASVVVCAYPIIELFFSIWRKHKRDGHHPGKPDQVHFHMLIYRRFVCIRFPNLSNTLKNSMASVVIFPFPLLSSTLAVFSYSRNIFLLESLVICVVIYLWIYYRLTRFVWFKMEGKSSL
jgi:UDP-N-acetylmuramyl pentapeptide phosphotransferase/UDP-N-acetylglucosamine-1-phosphate transferase